MLVTMVEGLCADPLYWRPLYLAGCMHKPIHRIIRDGPPARLLQQVNLSPALRAALLTRTSSSGSGMQNFIDSRD